MSSNVYGFVCPDSAGVIYGHAHMHKNLACSKMTKQDGKSDEIHDDDPGDEDE